MKQTNDIVNFYDEDGNLVGVSKISKRDDELNSDEELQALQDKTSPPQSEPMNEEASIAYEIWINSATLQNDFTPITERKLAELLTTKGISSRSTLVFSTAVFNAACFIVRFNSLFSIRAKFTLCSKS